MAATSVKWTDSKTPIYLALDIETTGCGVYGGMPTGDIILAFGAAWGIYDEAGYQVKVLGSQKFVVDMGKSKETSWAELWKIRGYDWKCWTEFWSKEEAQLNKLQEMAKMPEVGVASTKELSDAFNNFLVKLETQYSITLIFDTVIYDGGWLNNLLISHGYPPLYNSREGDYRSGKEVDSFTEGVLQTSSLSWRDTKVVQAWTLDVVLTDMPLTTNDHDPENDARHILMKYLRARTVESKKRQALIELGALTKDPQMNDFPQFKAWIKAHWEMLRAD